MRAKDSQLEAGRFHACAPQKKPAYLWTAHSAAQRNRAFKHRRCYGLGMRALGNGCSGICTAAWFGHVSSGKWVLSKMNDIRRGPWNPLLDGLARKLGGRASS